MNGKPMSESICEGETCEGCQSEKRNTVLCKPPAEWAEYVKRWRKPMSKSTERIVVVKIRTDASGEFCDRKCPAKINNMDCIFGTRKHAGIHECLAACRAAEIEVDESALEIADIIIISTRKCEDQNYLACCYHDFATAAGKIK